MTIRVTRDAVTPLVIGVFALMAVTGAMMFFHQETNLQKEVHEWAGWIMVGGVALHAWANWPGFKRYFQKLASPAVAVVGGFVLVLAGSFLVRGGDEGPSPPVLAIGALTKAPIAVVAPVFGKTAAQARADLAAAGIVITDDQGSIAGAVAGDREKTGAALRVLGQKG
jgi:peptidoglycan/LPS O-acetylase OafA/YrhL